VEVLGASVRILDPGTGTGLLSAAICEALPTSVRRVHIDAFEVYGEVARAARLTLGSTVQWLRERGVECTFDLRIEDFLTSEAGETYDVAISNPPYFKLNREDPRVDRFAEVVHGQPNIYALFMIAMAQRLGEGGALVTITPRSFTSGEYFRRFREVLFARTTPEVLHLFSSRRATFKADSVLQENVIMRARRSRPARAATVAVSVSAGGADLGRTEARTLPLLRVLDTKGGANYVHIPANRLDDEVLALVRKWPETLGSLSLKVSTGPVVAFRATEFLLQRAEDDGAAVPLLWLQHIRRMRIQWPIRGAKPEYIRAAKESEYLLLPNRTYVVMRRFSAKEEAQRLTAAPLLAGELPGAYIGLENHLNYIRWEGGEPEEDEAIGLAALLNGRIVDRFFRISNGNTQVSAVELRHLPLPSRDAIAAIGRAVRLSGDLDRVVADVLRIPSFFADEAQWRDA
jgi:adenine-specific DNA-methyltransferase